MDELKSEVRGNRGLRRKENFRVLNYIRNNLPESEKASPKRLGKLLNTRKSCDCFICTSGDHSKSISSIREDCRASDQLKELSIS